jgi:hypothetical protein
MPRLTAVQIDFLQRAIGNEGNIVRPARWSGWNVAGTLFGEKTGEVLSDRGLIAAVKEAGGGNTKRLGTGYHYCITDAGRAALAKSTQPPEITMSEVMAAIPRYQSHKKVWAFKIKTIRHVEKGGAIITPEDSRYGPFHVDDAYMQKHGPQEGGFYFVFDDAYKSWSPALAFESGYIKIS